MSETVMMLVEDEPLIALSIQASLEEAGHLVHYVESGNEAARALDSGTPRIYALLTDIRCGQGVDGWEVSRKARQQNPELPVIYMSGDCAAEHAARGVPRSIMVAKPFAAPQLLAAVRSLLPERPTA